jgi:hypothetical protein
MNAAVTNVAAATHIFNPENCILHPVQKTGNNAKAAHFTDFNLV